MFTLNHLHCWSRDPEAAAAAYAGLFAAEKIAACETANGLRVIIRLAGHLIYIEQAPPQEIAAGRMGLEHFALGTSAFDDVIAGLRRSGACFLIEPIRAKSGVRIAFVEVPDGGRVEIVEEV